MMNWKQSYLSALILLSAGNYASAEWKVADIGFSDNDFYIGLLPENLGADFVYQVSVCSTRRQKCEPLNACKYSEAKLTSNIEAVRDPKVRKDFDWVFLRSGYSSTTLDAFFSELTELLHKIRPDCQTHNLDSLKLKLNVP